MANFASSFVLLLALLLHGHLVFAQDCAGIAPGFRAVDTFTLSAETNPLTAQAAVNSDGTVNVFVEIPSGTTAKWELDKSDGALRWEFRKGKPRIVAYLGYPGNYGFIPRTLLPKEKGGDGDPLDVLVIGSAVPRGSTLTARVIGVLRLVDEGEQDDKLIAVRPGEAFAGVQNLRDLDSNFPGITSILETWFTNYDGKGVTVSKGFGDAEEARKILQVAEESFSVYSLRLRL